MSYQQHILVDGYNVILRQTLGSMPDEQALHRAREELIASLVAFRGKKRIRITIVFDGRNVHTEGQLHRPGGISVLFSKPPLNADQTILQIIAQAKHQRDITLITSDNALANAAKGYGCLVWSVENFSQKLVSKSSQMGKKYNGNISQQEVDEWIELFNNGDAE